MSVGPVSHPLYSCIGCFLIPFCLLSVSDDCVFVMGTVFSIRMDGAKSAYEVIVFVRSFMFLVSIPYCLN